MSCELLLVVGSRLSSVIMPLVSRAGGSWVETRWTSHELREMRVSRDQCRPPVATRPHAREIETCIMFCPSACTRTNHSQCLCTETHCILYSPQRRRACTRRESQRLARLASDRCGIHYRYSVHCSVDSAQDVYLQLYILGPVQWSILSLSCTRRRLRVLSCTC